MPKLSRRSPSRALAGAASGAVDPTFELIEEHRAAHKLWDAAVLKIDGLGCAGHKCRDDVACGNPDCIYHQESCLAGRVSKLEKKLRRKVPPTLAGLHAKVAHLLSYPDRTRGRRLR